MTDHEQKKVEYTLSHLGILRYFVIWGILESVVFLFTKGDRFKSLTIYLTSFLLLTIVAYMYPMMIDFL
jgi:hypothetical protein